MSGASELSRSPVALCEDSTLIAVVEMGQSSWLVAGLLPGVERRPLKKLAVDQDALLSLLHRWRDEAEKAGHPIGRIYVAYEAGRDGFWLARWLRARGIEAHVMHASSIPVKRDHRRAKTDRLDCRLLMRAFVGWLRGEAEHCRMVAIPSLEAEDARRAHRERASLVGERTRVVNRMKAVLAWLGIRGFNPALRKAGARLEGLRTPQGGPLPPNTAAELRRAMARLRVLDEQIKEIEAARRQRLARAPDEAHHAMVCLLAQVHGLGIETADILVTEVLSRTIPNRRALARYGGLTGAPDESGKRRREKGLARAGNARVHDPTRLALPPLPEGQRARALVSRAHRRRARRPAQDHDRGARAQAADRALALRHPGRRARGRRPQARSMSAQRTTGRPSTTCPARP